MRTGLVLCVLGSVVACDGSSQTEELPPPNPDLDGDGFDDPEDCDDDNALVHPEAVERLNGIDDNCDGVVDRMSLDRADVTLEGSQHLDQAGWPIAGVGDMNGDGFPEVVIGAFGADTAGTGSGGVFLMYGSSDRVSSGALVDTGPFFAGESAGSQAGTGASAAGDVNGDGYDDLAIGAFNYGADLRGAVYLVQGGADRLEDRSLADAEVRLEGEPGMWLGFATAAAGDVNGDGYADVVAGAIAAKTDGVQGGGALVMLGSETGFQSGSALDQGVWLWSKKPMELAGSSVAGPVDFNGDGFDDVVVGATGMTGSAGKVYFVSGAELNDRDLDDADWTFTGNSGALAGWSIASLGDVDEDGYDEMLIGAPADTEETGLSEAGATYLIKGSAEPLASLGSEDADLVLTGETPEDWAGGIVSGAGDVNGDGQYDILVGAAGAHSNGAYSGSSYLVLGPTSGHVELATADAIFMGNGDYDSSGTVAGPGDVDGDGFDDLFIGAIGRDQAEMHPGRVYLMFGSLF